MRSVKRRLFASLLAFIMVFTTISWDGIVVFANPADEVVDEATSGNDIVVDEIDAETEEDPQEEGTEIILQSKV